VEVTIGESGGGVELTVQDNGAGIAPELIPHVFERYKQGDGGARRQRGLGLGLAIARHLVARHQGTIEAFSEGPNRGARFVVRLPALSPAASASVPSLIGEAAPR